MNRFALILVATLALAGCSAEPIWAPDDAVAQAAYQHDGPSSITVYTIVKNSTGKGAHSGLLINGHQRVLFDPAGTFSVNVVPERNDVHYGITEQIRGFYELFHARESYHTVAQEVLVSPEIANLAIQKVEAYGAVSKMMCTVAVTDILSEIPGFEHIENSMYPERLREAIATMDGVTERSVYDWDDDDKEIVLGEFNDALQRYRDETSTE
ncbi:MAG: hypothetical protein P8L68_10105 [Paracoccaceae bacterium]|nr:hypothetical protein [Paracoccaceae bacterium]MDG1736345.1 hypothetical protein [Paracoccaceae bacterium]MDG2258831.1 hypothetical protein [Paracoccaceae bacterium]